MITKLYSYLNIMCIICISHISVDLGAMQLYTKLVLWQLFSLETHLPLFAITVTFPMIQLNVKGIFSTSFIICVNVIGALPTNKKGRDELIHPGFSDHIRELSHMALSTLEQ